VGATSACTTVTSRLGTALGQICCVEANDNALCQSQSRRPMTMGKTHLRNLAEGEQVGDELVGRRRGRVMNIRRGRRRRRRVAEVHLQTRRRVRLVPRCPTD
jgi:hypothetical protein